METAPVQWRCNCCPIRQNKNCRSACRTIWLYWAGFKCDWLLCNWQLMIIALNLYSTGNYSAVYSVATKEKLPWYTLMSFYAIGAMTFWGPGPRLKKKLTNCANFEYDFVLVWHVMQNMLGNTDNWYKLPNKQALTTMTMTMQEELFRRDSCAVWPYLGAEKLPLRCFKRRNLPHIRSHKGCVHSKLLSVKEFSQLVLV